MSLIGTLNVGKSALAVHQAAIQVTSNNIANAGNPNYTRQTVAVVPRSDQQVQPGMFMGTGVDILSIRRQIDEALEGRLRGTISDNEAAGVNQQWLGRMESIFNELGSDDLSTQLSNFFTSWGTLANKPQDVGLRQNVIQTGQTVANWVQELRGQFSDMSKDVDDRMSGLATDANQLAQQVADLNQQIVQNEGGSNGVANSLRDQRDTVLKKLSELMDIKTVPVGEQIVNVVVGNQPLVNGYENRGVYLKQELRDGKTVSNLAIKADDAELVLGSGQMGALQQVKTELDGVIDQVDSLAGNLIFALNKIHSSGQGIEGLSEVMGTNVAADSTAALNSDAADLAFKPVNGSFVVHVRHKSTGLTTSTLVKVDMDGLGGNDTSLNSLVADLNGIDNISAVATAGKLKVTADSSEVEFSFSQDTSGVLAALGVNTFFTGQDASDIAVSDTIIKRPTLLSAAQNGEKGDNQTALAISGMESTALDSLNGTSLKDTYQSMINGLAVKVDGAKTNAEATKILRDTLETQREAISGVSLDEEAINLIREQRAFQGAARIIAAVDEMMKTILQM